MKHNGSSVDELKIAYVGGGSRGWAWSLMSDLALASDISGSVALYDIDYDAACANEIIGNRIVSPSKDGGRWGYKAVKTLDEALTGADFVIISILPGTFKEMESDVHAPEEYGIYQSVGDTTGPGGLIRALRTLPMFEVIGDGIRRCCPTAWVINYTNPMTVCLQTLYRAFPEIHAFGCCHEVFGTQNFLASVLMEKLGIKATRDDIKVSVTGVNHFTWLTEAHYKNLDLYPIYREFCREHAETGYVRDQSANTLANYFKSAERVKMDLFLRYGVIGAAGDRHLAEFLPGNWYMSDPECVARWKFMLTPVSYRFDDLEKRLARSERLKKGEESFTFASTGEEGVHQIRAILGLCDLVTNVNLPNMGQISNLPMGAVVETNAQFSAGSVKPVCAGALPESIYPLIAPVVGRQRLITEAAAARDIELAYRAFVLDPLVRLPYAESRELFDKMCANTASYLGEYGIK